MNVPDVSIILPVYNETARLVPGLTAVVEYLAKQDSKKAKKPLRSRAKKPQSLKAIKKLTWEIIMIDDGSNVPAAEVINHSHLQSTISKLIKQKKFRGYRLSENQGKGKAIATGVFRAKGKYIVFMDIDGSVPITSLPQFMNSLKNSPIAIGSRRIPESVIAVHQPFFRETGGRIYTFLSQSMFSLSIHDATCGFKGFQRDVARDLFGRQKISRWAFDTELLALAVERGYAVEEIPVVWSNKMGSKVTVSDTLESFFDILRIYWYKVTDAYDINNQEVQTMKSSSNLSVNRSFLCDGCGSSEFNFLFDHHHNWDVQQCKQCGLTQVLPRPTRKEVAALYHNDESHFDPYIEQERVHRTYFRNKLLTIRNQLRLKRNTSPARLLDVGCLTGVLLDEAGKMGINAEGLDISKDAVTFCKNRGFTAYQGTLERFIKKYPRKKYNVVTAFEIIEHEYSPYTLVQSMYKLLPEGGIAAVSTPNHGSWWRMVMGKRWPGYTHPEHLYFFDSQSLAYLFKRVGFSEVTVTSGDSRPFPLWFLFKRGADYFPEFASILKMLASMTKLLPLKNPINPWDDLLIIAKK